MAGFRFFVAKKQFEIAISIGINPKPLLTMEGCTEFTNVTCNVTTTLFMKDGIIMGKRIITTNDKKMTKDWYNAEDKYHREGDQPAIIYYEDDKIVSQHWCKNGKRHREGDQPAMIHYKDGKIVSQQWYKDGKLHREGDQPALICYKDGKIIDQWWYKDGKLHREGDQPAMIEYKDGKIFSQSWYKNGVKQPEPKPKEPIEDILVRIRKDLAEIEARLAENAK